MGKDSGRPESSPWFLSGSSFLLGFLGAGLPTAVHRCVSLLWRISIPPTKAGKAGKPWAVSDLLPSAVGLCLTAGTKVVG